MIFILKDYLNKKVTVKIDRPLGSKHPKYNYSYPLNYGYIPGTMAEDGEELDAYILGEFEPLVNYSGKVIAIVKRKDDVENKLIVSNKHYSVEQIKALIEFQERYFEIEIIS